MIDDEETFQISKLEAADRQLCVAIDLFFSEGDSVVVHTLACAAREIYEKHCKKKELSRMFDCLKFLRCSYSDKQLWNCLNQARNFFKHEGSSLEESLLFSDGLNDLCLYMACKDCMTLYGKKRPPIEIMVFLAWFKILPEPANCLISDELAKEIEQLRSLFPEVGAKEREIQKREGKRILAIARKEAGINYPNCASTATANA